MSAGRLIKTFERAPDDVLGSAADETGRFDVDSGCTGFTSSACLGGLSVGVNSKSNPPLKSFFAMII